MRQGLSFPLIVIFCSTVSVALAGEAISVHAPWVREAPPNVPMAGYLELSNDSDQSRALVAATADGFANTMIHRTEFSDGQASMVHVDKVELAPNTRVRFEPGGLHIMLMRPQRRLSAGDVVMIRLEFDDGTFLDVAFPVRKAKDMPSGHSGDSHEHHEASHEHGHAERVVEVEGDGAPTLDLSVDQDGSGAWTVRLKTTNFRFSREHADGAHVPGEGHAHLYVDGKKISRVYGNHYELGALDPGAHQITVGLYTNDHAAYAVAGLRVESRKSIRVDP